jgi:hypothetical protein
LKSEGIAFFIASIWCYSIVGASWWLFVVLLLMPDLFMVGYIKNSRLGAMLYNIGHTYTAPMTLLLIYMLFSIPVLLPIAIVWFAHISMDRMLGFGLKLDSGFKDTHLGKIGKT